MTTGEAAADGLLQTLTILGAPCAPNQFVGCSRALADSDRGPSWRAPPQSVIYLRGSLRHVCNVWSAHQRRIRVSG
eukprot:scaffold2878_cov73-Phaeocystis_antarctica.AAC.1